jgi:hypothetical protein
MTNNKRLAYVLTYVLALFLVACEKPVVDSEPEKEAETDGITLIFEAPTAEPYAEIGEASPAYATRNEALTQLSVSVFKGGKRVKSLHLSADNDLFMKPSLRLDDGTYSVVAVAHAGMGHATITNAQRITFYKNKITDTYVYCGEITVSGKSTFTLSMKRVTAMFQLSVTSPLPQNVAQVEFRYTGGSSTLDAKGLEGCVNSRQTETREVTEMMRTTPPTFAIYTFPRTDSEGLKIKVSFNDKNGNTLYEENYEEVQVKLGMKTCYKCNLPKDFVDALSKEGCIVEE